MKAGGNNKVMKTHCRGELRALRLSRVGGGKEFGKVRAERVWEARVAGLVVWQGRTEAVPYTERSFRL